MAALPQITTISLPENQYIKKVYDKHQIYVHHTASSADPYGVVDWWKSNKDRIGTAFIIAGRTPKNKKWMNGDIIQCFGSQYAGWHLGLTKAHLKKGGATAKSSSWLNLNTIGIEICSWGQLTLKADGKFYTYAGNTIPEDQVTTFATPYRGFKYYQKYSDLQIENTRKLLRFLADKYDIDSKFKGMKMFDICPAALQGERGIWTHTSVRPDKFDCQPQIELVQMLQSL